MHSVNEQYLCFSERCELGAEKIIWGIVLLFHVTEVNNTACRVIYGCHLFQSTHNISQTDKFCIFSFSFIISFLLFFDVQIFHITYPVLHSTFHLYAVLLNISQVKCVVNLQYRVYLYSLTKLCLLFGLWNQKIKFHVQSTSRRTSLQFITSLPLPVRSSLIQFPSIFGLPCGLFSKISSLIRADLMLQKTSVTQYIPSIYRI